MITFASMATFGASAYFITLAPQTVRDWSALATGPAFILPCACVLVGTVIGVRGTLVIGLVVGAIGTAVFAAFLGNGSAYAQMVPGIVIFSIAQGVIRTAMFSAATTGAEDGLQAATFTSAC
ncbi:hypothetical protein ABZV75_16145 [Streptomyces flaveolus]|uniref:hypothetical protein n=1 Tax=Streptomyces flaveolus TaxID=67297 RepID=UPI0033A8BAD6